MGSGRRGLVRSWRVERATRRCSIFFSVGIMRRGQGHSLLMSVEIG